MNPIEHRKKRKRSIKRPSKNISERRRSKPKGNKEAIPNNKRRRHIKAHIHTVKPSQCRSPWTLRNRKERKSNIKSDRE
jgi:hypothetical protein